MHPDWARALHTQCINAGIPFLFKQHGEYIEIPEDEMRDGDFYLIGREHQKTDGKWNAVGNMELVFEKYPWRREEVPMKGAEAGRWSPWRDVPMRNVGKKNAGNVLDGREWMEFPQVLDNSVIRLEARNVS